MGVALAIDVGGTQIKAGIVQQQGRIAYWDQRPMDAAGGKSCVRACLAAALERLAARARARGWRPQAVGVGFPGTIHGSRGRVLTAPPQIPGVAGLELSALCEQLSGLPAVALNDADAAALGEARAGAGVGRDVVLAVTVGTGLGGGLVMGGQLLRGRFGTALEIGQTVFRPDLFPGPLGGTCRLEHAASATALLRLWRRAGGGRGQTVRDIVAGARAGDARALEALAQVGRNLGLGLANAALLMAPDVIVVGGGLSAAGRLLLDPLRRTFKQAVLPYTSKGCRVLAARLGNRAGLLGAGLLALESA